MLRWLTFWGMRVLEAVIVACLVVMGVLVFGNVVLRYGFNSGIAVSEELSRLLFVWLIFLGAILASRQHVHIGFDSLVKLLPDRWKKLALLVSGGLMLFGCGLFILGGWRQTVINLDNSYPVLGISYAWLYAANIVFGVGMMLSILANLLEVFARVRPQEALILTQNLGDRIERKMGQVAGQEEAAQTDEERRP